MTSASHMADPMEHLSSWAPRDPLLRLNDEALTRCACACAFSERNAALHLLGILELMGNCGHCRQFTVPQPFSNMENDIQTRRQKALQRKEEVSACNSRYACNCFDGNSRRHVNGE